VLIHDATAATHLYHIVQEAVNNALKHGQVRTITIALGSNGERGALSISDDGTGIVKPPPNSKGMGLHIMNYRARMIGGTMEIYPAKPRGTVVMCSFPVSNKE
jgi:signal transduction histidine kinase